MVRVGVKSPWIQNVKIKALDIVDKEFIGNTPPTVFVGSKYIQFKKANVGILSPLENKEEAWKYDNPYHWYENNYDIKKIVELRTNLINARKKAGIFDIRTDNRFLELAQEIAMSFKPTTIDVKLEKKLIPKVNIDNIHLPFGPSGNVKSIEAEGNIKFNNKIEKVFYDTDLKAVDGIRILTKGGIPEYQLSQLLSIGIMGMKKNRKLVPTRFSITATDDVLGKDYIKEIKEFSIIDNYKLYFGNYFGNYYLVLMFPEVWGYELFESAVPDGLIDPDFRLYTMTDYEDYYGRKEYAENCVGGYYAARLSLLEELKKLKVQASCLLLRYVTSEYSTPLGVFVVRQAVRKTLSSEKYEFTNKKDMLDFAKKILFNKLGYNIDNQLRESIMLNTINKQIKLSNFF